MKRFIFLLSTICTLFAQSTAVDFTTTDVQGNQHNLFDVLDQGKYVCLYMFFTTCGSCIGAAPNVYDAYRQFGCNQRDIVFWGMNSGSNSNADIIEFANNYMGGNLDMPLCDGRGVPNFEFINYQLYGVSSYTRIMLIAPDRSIVESSMSSYSLISTISSHGLTTQPCTPPLFMDGNLQLLTQGGTLCNHVITPTFNLTNQSDTTLYTFTVSYGFTGGTMNSYTWNGSLDSGLSVTVTLPNLYANLGSQDLQIELVSVNQVLDDEPSNNVGTINLNVVSLAPHPTPLQEGFEGATFPPPLFKINNPSGTTWQKTTQAAKSGISSVYIDNYSLNNQIGAVDDLMSDIFEFPNNQTITFSFDLAYAPYSQGGSDSLQVLISTDCGQSYQVLYDLYGTTLYTTSPFAGPFVPTNASQWKHFSKDLSNYAGSSSVQFAFRNKSSYENNLYLDNINVIASAVSIDQEEKVKMDVFPNPAKDILNVFYEGKEIEAPLFLIDVSGRIIKQTNIVSGETIQMDVRDLASGVYILQIGKTDSGRKKILVE